MGPYAASAVPEREHASILVRLSEAQAADFPVSRTLLEILSREVDKMDGAARPSPTRQKLPKLAVPYARRRARTCEAPAKRSKRSEPARAYARAGGGRTQRLQRAYAREGAGSSKLWMRHFLASPSLCAGRGPVGQRLVSSERRPLISFEGTCGARDKERWAMVNSARNAIRRAVS
jgi:hypothetical protein